MIDEKFCESVILPLKAVLFLGNIMLLHFVVIKAIKRSLAIFKKNTCDVVLPCRISKVDISGYFGSLRGKKKVGGYRLF